MGWCFQQFSDPKSHLRGSGLHPTTLEPFPQYPKGSGVVSRGSWCDERPLTTFTNSRKFLSSIGGSSISFLMVDTIALVLDQTQHPWNSSQRSPETLEYNESWHFQPMRMIPTVGWCFYQSIKIQFLEILRKSVEDSLHLNDILDISGSHHDVIFKEWKHLKVFSKSTTPPCSIMYTSLETRSSLSPVVMETSGWEQNEIGQTRYLRYILLH